MNFADINIRDPFILKHEGKYYMYGTRAANTWDRVVDKYTLGFDVYVSDDLKSWSAPKPIFEYYDGFWGEAQFWAPEVHKYNGKFYMLATCIADGYHRGTAIFECDTPDGIFKEHSNGALTPSEWDCLDGTLYVENETPYMIFCHEWTQIKNGTICALELSRDLKRAIGEPIYLFSAGDASWRYDIRDNGSYVTDGPFAVRRDKELALIWSSFYKDEYCQAVAHSSNGKIDGKWTIDDKLLFERNGGHGMIFSDNGKNYFVFHTPNDTPNERPCLKEININTLFDK
ncbi:MAG: family 43 glycosylhydrolase [Clostridia bacterium]|nr:family 43 glycosylhydrolase [Clostridia bacterium]